MLLESCFGAVEAFPSVLSLLAFGSTKLLIFFFDLGALTFLESFESFTTTVYILAFLNVLYMISESSYVAYFIILVILLPNTTFGVFYCCPKL